MADEHKQILQRSLEKIAKDENYEHYEYSITAIAANGNNFTSKLYQATITAPNKPDLKLFAKVATAGEAFRSQMLTDIFSVENYAYETLAKIYERIQDKHEVPEEHRLEMPKFYHYDGTYLEETLVLQDMSAEGYTTYGRLEGMNLEFASKSLEHLSRLHALSIAFQIEYPDEFSEATKTLKFKSPEESVALINTMEMMITNSAAAVCEELKDRLQKFLDKEVPGFMQKFAGPDKRAVLNHGDFRMGNIMYKLKNDNIDVAVVDYQCMHVGVGARDILYFLIPSTDEEFREKHFNNLLDHYYEQLCATLRRLKQDPEELFPRKDFDSELKKNLPYGLLVAMLMLPALTAAISDSPTVDDDLNVETILHVPTSSLFETRLNGVVRDFAKWGVI